MTDEEKIALLTEIELGNVSVVEAAKRVGASVTAVREWRSKFAAEARAAADSRREEMVSDGDVSDFIEAVLRPDPGASKVDLLRIENDRLARENAELRAALLLAPDGEQIAQNKEQMRMMHETVLDLANEGARLRKQCRALAKQVEELRVENEGLKRGNESPRGGGKKSAGGT